MNAVVLIACACFYAVLCVFSLVTGLMYASGKRELNPLELSDTFLQKYQDPIKRKQFTIRMGWVTFAVGIVQGLTSFAIFRAGSVLDYALAVGFTVFSICSVGWKLKGKLSVFSLLKSVAYAAILLVLILVRDAFF